MPPDLIAFFLLAGSSGAVSIAIVAYVGFSRSETPSTLVVMSLMTSSLLRFSGPPGGRMVPRDTPEDRSRTARSLNSRDRRWEIRVSLVRGGLGVMGSRRASSRLAHSKFSRREWPISLRTHFLSPEYGRRGAYPCARLQRPLLRTGSPARGAN